MNILPPYLRLISFFGKKSKAARLLIGVSHGLNKLIAGLFFTLNEIIIDLLSLPLYLREDIYQEKDLFNSPGNSFSLYKKRRGITFGAIVSLFGVISGYFLITSLIFFSIVRPGSAALITWDGEGVDELWSTAANWSGDTIPGLGDIAVFDDTSDKNAIIDPGFGDTVGGIEINANYAGEITLTTPLTVTTTFTQAGGVFQSGSDSLTINGNFTQTGGTFYASAATTSFHTNFTQTGGTFVPHATGIFELGGTQPVNSVINVQGSLSIPNITINKSNNFTFTFTDMADRLIATENLNYLNGRINGGSGYLEAQGDFYYSPDIAEVGSGRLVISGDPRTINLAEGTIFPQLFVSSTDSIVNLTGTDTTTFHSLYIYSGTVNQNTAPIRVATAHFITQGENSTFVGGSANVSVQQFIYSVSGASVTFASGTNVSNGGILVTNGSSTLDMSGVTTYTQSGSTAYARIVDTATFYAPDLWTTYGQNNVSHGTLRIESPNFFHNSGTIVFAATTTDQGLHLSTSTPTTFYNFTKNAGASTTLYFSSSTTAIFAGTLTLTGLNTSTLLHLRSYEDGEETFIDVQNPATVANLSVRDNHNINSSPIVASDQYVIDDGNVVGWFGLLDVTNPSNPGALSVISTSSNSAVLGLSTTSSDNNFLEYRLYYNTNSTTPATTDDFFSSSTLDALGSVDFNNQNQINLTGLTPSTEYLIDIFAFDSYGNLASSTMPISFRTGPSAPGNLSITGSSQSSISVSWEANGNPSTTQYQVSISPSSASQSGTGLFSHTFSGLSSRTEYTITVLVTDIFGGTNSSAISMTTGGSSGGLIPPTPPPSGGGGGGSSGGTGTNTPTTTTPTDTNTATTNTSTTNNNPPPNNTSQNPAVLACGNYILEPLYGEQCDDGNTQDNDGCSTFCLIEPPPTPPPAPPPPVTPPPRPAPSAPREDPPPPPSQNNQNTNNASNGTAPIIELEDDQTEVGGTIETPPPIEPIIPIEETPIVPPEPPEEIIILPQEQILPPEEKPVQTEIVAETINEASVNLIEEIKKIADDPDIEAASKGVIAPAAAIASTALILPSIFSSIIPLLRFLFLQPILLLGLRKKDDWGEVYNSTNNVPIDLATVRLLDETSGRPVATRVTDEHGRFLFSPPAGRYKIVANKEGFLFPTVILSGQEIDGEKKNLYHGDIFEQKEAGVPVLATIPLDPQNEADHAKKRTKNNFWRFFQETTALFGLIANLIIFGLNPSYSTAGFLAVQTLVFLGFKKITKRPTPKHYGLVEDGNSLSPLPNCILRLYSLPEKKLVATMVSNDAGHYAFLVGKGRYILTAETGGYERFESKEIEVKDATKAFVAKKIRLTRQKDQADIGINLMGV